jgi:hypothetical protein
MTAKLLSDHESDGYDDEHAGEFLAVAEGASNEMVP